MNYYNYFPISLRYQKLLKNIKKETAVDETDPKVLAQNPQVKNINTIIRVLDAIGQDRRNV